MPPTTARETPVLPGELLPARGNTREYGRFAWGRQELWSFLPQETKLRAFLQRHMNTCRAASRRQGRPCTMPRASSRSSRLIGLVAGWLASWLVGGSGLIRYALTGMIGSCLGAIFLDRLGVDLGLQNDLARRIATATIGAVLVILVARLLA